MNKNVYTIIILFLMAWGVSLLCDRCGCSTPKGNDTISVRVDSIRDTTIVVVHDTIPKMVTEKVVKYVTVKEIIEDTSEDCSDTILPVVQKEYSDDTTYTAYVSGVKYGEYPKLDSIDVKSRIITNTITKTITIEKKRSRFKVGVQAGYGYGFLHKGFEPYVGLGVTYAIFN